MIASTTSLLKTAYLNQISDKRHFDRLSYMCRACSTDFQRPSDRCYQETERREDRADLLRSVRSAVCTRLSM